MSRVLPMLFNTEMVQAILRGDKTVTRRVCKAGNDYVVPDMSFYDANKRTYAVRNYANKGHKDRLSISERTCPICPGDILYVRETWLSADECNGVKYYYKADETENSKEVRKIYGYKWHPSIHMPKEVARIWLKVTDVRVERLQDITEEQAKAEGISEEWACAWWKPTFNDPDSGGYPEYRKTFAWDLWDSTIKKLELDTYGWKANPWVWVIEFEKCEKPKESE